MGEQVTQGNLVQYRHLEKLYGYLPGMDQSLMAQLFGLGLEGTVRSGAASTPTPATWPWSY
jgi:hypothetical protein